MGKLRYKLILLISTTLFTFSSVIANAFIYDISPNKILIGKDNISDGDVYLNKFSIVNVNNKIKRATHSVIIDNFTDKHTEEYIADYNCTDKTIHLISMSIIENYKNVGEKKLDSTNQVNNDVIQSKLLDIVCSYNNSKLAPKRRVR